MTVQLTITSSSTPAPQPGTDVDPAGSGGSAAPVKGEFGPGAGAPTLPAAPGRPGDVEPALSSTRVRFGPGPAPVPPRPGGSAPGTTPDPTPRPGTGGQSAGGGATGGGDSSGSGSAGGGSSTSGPGGHAGTSGSRPARRGPAGPALRPGRGPTSGLAARPVRRRSRIVRGIAAVRRARAYLTGPSPVGVPAGQLAGVPAPRSVRAPGRGPVSGTPVLGWLTSRLGRWWRTGQGRVSRLTDEDRRVIAILAVAVIVALGGQADLSAPDPAQTPAAATAGTTTSARRVLDLAESQVGTVEGRDGGTPYHRDYGIADDQPWCAVFVWDMFREAGAADLIGPKTAYTPTLAAWFHQHDQWSSAPTVGALVFYDWPSDGRDRIQHVGLVESIGPNTITTIEANTSSGVAGSQANGGGVWRRTRPRNASIVGYGLPAYSLNHQQP